METSLFWVSCHTGWGYPPSIQPPQFTSVFFIKTTDSSAGSSGRCRELFMHLGCSGHSRLRGGSILLALLSQYQNISKHDVTLIGRETFPDRSFPFFLLCFLLKKTCIFQGHSDPSTVGFIHKIKFTIFITDQSSCRNDLLSCAKQVIWSCPVYLICI